MKKNVCMFVWNHFTNDARVLRECTALSENGYKVDLICIHDPSDKSLPKFEVRNDGFRVFRVRRYPFLLDLMQGMAKRMIKNKLIGLLGLMLWLTAIYFIPYISAIITFLAIILLKSKLKVVWIRGNIFLRMIVRGLQQKYDIYHSNDLNTLPQGYICSKLRIKKKKLVYDSHEVQTSRTGYDKSFYGKSEKFFIKKIDTMIVENHTRAKYNEELYDFYPNVVHNYPFKQDDNRVKKAPLHDILDLPKEEKILLYQGGIQAGRGLEKLIQAVPLFNEGTLVFIGDGRIKTDLLKMVDEMNLHNRVKFLPKVPVEELPSYTKNAYLGFQVLNNTNFNHYSASSNKLFEYIMSGVPIVACSFPEIKRVVEGEQVGVCVDSHDYESIAEGVNFLLTDIETRKNMVDNCFKAKFIYNWENEKVNFLSIYRVLVT
ncbi:glycosyltransferase [Ornithinibacillus sp. BX22]|uniref:Glycosyltransferase n=2 Tax=Ornithinibacillus TaxID=484508 RepID=A0A923L3B3_9BACI|nr:MULTISPECIES: glycosyltransferase [Ornithinibacillus]MBC5635718.1 glycosyltransferase [Ornithinibacillus hominis]MBS3679329.1 glycosyltransferase [Ornithinibacillus massiliensis]